MLQRAKHVPIAFWKNSKINYAFYAAGTYPQIWS